jgi:hypothetical protein
MPTRRQVRDQRRHFRSSLLYCQYSGDVTGELVYVNYGTVEDIRELHQMGVNLTGREQSRLKLLLPLSTSYILRGHCNIIIKYLQKGLLSV